MQPEEIQALRRSLGLSQVELGNRLDVSQALVSLWENGHSRPNDTQVGQMGDLQPAERRVDGGEDDANDEAPFGEWLLRERTSAGLSRARLAEQAGVSEPTIFLIESGRTTTPRRSTRESLEAALGSEVPEAVSQALDEQSVIEDVGTFESFDPHDADDLPAEPGIYVFYDNADHVIYVGQSGDIRGRIRGDHQDRFWYHPKLVTSASFVRVEDRRLRLQIERTLIKFLKSNAVLNERHVER